MITHCDMVPQLCYNNAGSNKPIVQLQPPMELRSEVLVPPPAEVDRPQRQQPRAQQVNKNPEPILPKPMNNIVIMPPPVEMPIAHVLPSTADMPEIAFPAPAAPSPTPILPCSCRAVPLACTIPGPGEASSGSSPPPTLHTLPSSEELHQFLLGCQLDDLGYAGVELYDDSTIIINTTMAKKMHQHLPVITNQVVAQFGLDRSSLMVIHTQVEAPTPVGAAPRGRGRGTGRGRRR